MYHYDFIEIWQNKHQHVKKWFKFHIKMINIFRASVYQKTSKAAI